MTVRMRLRRWARAQGKRRAAARTKRSTAAGSRRREQQPSGASQLRFLRLTVCGALFVSLVLLKLVLPANLPTFVNALKVNVGLSWVGVIMGEFLVSRAGLGYLIVYGSQVFNMDLVMASVLALGAAAVGMYLLVLRAEKFLNSVWGVRV